MEIKINKNKILYTRIILIIILLFNMLPSIVCAESMENNKKVIVYIMDEMSLDEILESNTPNIDRLIENGSIGFMNTRGRSSLSNRGSRYLSLGMGVRTLGSTKGKLAFDVDSNEELIENDLSSSDIEVRDLYELNTGKSLASGEIVNIAISDIKRQALNITPNNEVGSLGKIARENNLSIGFLGNTDTRNTTSRESTLIAIDENGVIPYGSVSSKLVKEDKFVLGGLRTDDEELLKEFRRIENISDIIFIEYGDTSRIERTENITTDDIRSEQKKMAIERGDNFLGLVMDDLDLNNTRIILLTPNTSSTMSSDGNFGLTTMVVSDKNIKKGLLTSNTTRRKGLVTNFDFPPTVLTYLDENIDHQFIGEAIESVNSKSPIEILVNNQLDFLYLRQYRKVFHWIYIALVMILLIFGFIPYLFKKLDKFKLPSKLLDYLSLTIMSLPITMMFVSILGYRNILLDIIFVFIGGFIIGFILDKLLKNKIKTFGLLAAITSIILILDTYMFKELMIVSPLGSDAIAGGRFYGIGNDYMGILLGTSISALFILFDKLSSKSLLFISTLYLLLITVSLSPLVGANMGGTISALIALIFLFITILDKEISIKKIILVVSVVAVLILVIAGLDILFNPNPTHAGKAMKALVVDGQVSKLVEIISGKLRQVFWNLAYSPWNIVLFLELILLFLMYKRKNGLFEMLKERDNRIYKGIIVLMFTSGAIFLFNDTGTIGAALCMINLFVILRYELDKYSLE